MMTSARARYAGYRFPSEIISHAVWLYFRFPLGLRMVEELLAARGIIVSHETVLVALGCVPAAAGPHEKVIVRPAGAFRS
jgi:transposase-like protein